MFMKHFDACGGLRKAVEQRLTLTLVLVSVPAADLALPRAVRPPRDSAGERTQC